MSAYKSFVVAENGGVVSGGVAVKNSLELPSGDVLIRVKYSSLNYFDALSITGGVAGKYPLTPGIDAVGVVLESSVSDFHVGDEVIAMGHGLGVDIPGGFGEYVRVPAGSVLSLPAGLTMKDCMTIGSDGLAAALAVMDLIAAGGRSDNDSAVVTGAVSGTGCFALTLLAKCGFNVTAVIKDLSGADFAKTIGASEVISCEKFADTGQEAMLSEKYAVGVDTLGGNVLSSIVRSLKKNGSVAVCSAMVSDVLTVSLRPLMLRGVNILGINAADCPAGLQKEAWQWLAGEWYPKVLPMLCTEIALSELPEYCERFLKGEIKGRIVINHGL